MSTPEPEPDPDPEPEPNRRPDSPDDVEHYFDTDGGMTVLTIYDPANHDHAWIRSSSWHTPDDAEPR